MMAYNGDNGNLNNNIPKFKFNRFHLFNQLKLDSTETIKLNQIF